MYQKCIITNFNLTMETEAPICLHQEAIRREDLKDNKTAPLRAKRQGACSTSSIELAALHIHSLE